MISFVYFDVGGVVMLDTYGTDKWHQLKLDLGITEERMGEWDTLWAKYSSAIDTGTMHPDAFIAILKEEMRLPIPNSYSLNDDLINNRFEKNPSIWPVISEIHKTYRIGLLTNTYIDMFEKMEKRGLLPNEPWDIIVKSDEIHLKKPDKEIYEYAKKQAGVPHNEIFFVENAPKNIAGAQAIGWQTFLYDSSHPKEASKRLLDVYRKLL